MREPFPLQWPEGWPRTTNRHGRGTASYQAKFDTAFTRDRDSVIRQLKRRGANIVITSNLPLRGDGLPYEGSYGSDPGIAVYWIEKRTERVIACDRWRTPALNLRAIEMTIEALRGLDRWGASEVVERAFSGFTALPPGRPMPPAKRPWREVLGIDPTVFSRAPEIEFAAAKAKHRELIRIHHPDAGGSHELAADINAALAEAERELQGAR